MKGKRISVGVAYNVHVPLSGRENEEASEEATARSAHDVLAAVKSLGFRVTPLPLRTSGIEFLKSIRRSRIDVVINLCEGFRGRPQLEANVAALYELAGVPFTGSGFRTLALCQDKFQTKAVLRANGLPVPEGCLVDSPDAVLDQNFPVIVKPNDEDASIGVYSASIVSDRESLRRRLETILRTYNQPALVEEYIDGREFNVSVLEGDNLQALPVSEIDFSGMPESHPRIVSYEAKWFEDHNLFKSTPPVCPARIDKKLADRLQRLALEAFDAVGGKGYGRVDFRMARDGRLFVLEVNPNPDVGLSAGFARALAAARLEYKAFWQIMIEKAMGEKKR